MTAQEVDRARRAELLAEVLGDLEALDAVPHPERAHLRVGAREREPIRRKRVREERGVEVEADAALLRPGDPRREVLGLDLVAVRHLALVDAVAGVEVQAVLAGDELEREVGVRHQLLRRARLARIVAGRLDAAGRAAGRLEPADVVALPAVHRNADLLQRLDRLLGVNAEFLVLGLRGLVGSFAHRFSLLFAGTVPEMVAVIISKIRAFAEYLFGRAARVGPPITSTPFPRSALAP